MWLILHDLAQRVTVDLEIKFSSVENPELSKVIHFQHGVHWKISISPAARSSVFFSFFLFFSPPVIISFILFLGLSSDKKVVCAMSSDL